MAKTKNPAPDVQHTATAARAATGIRKARTGIDGLDELTGGGLPAGRPTLVCGAAGCGKTLLALTFLYNGAAQFDEPGVFMTFEERPEDLIKNVASLHYDVQALIDAGKFAIDHVRVERNEIEETGEYDLEGLFIRLGYAIDKIGAKRVVLDTIEALFSGLSNQAILRAELRRMFEWLKDRGVTAIITGERGEGQLTRHGLEEYVSDCVILLDHRVHENTTTRRLRVVKYRGTSHGTNEYPFLIDDSGISVMPVTSAGLDHVAPDQRISSGIPHLDVMLEGRGYFRGSSILVSGMAGSGKSSVAAQFADSVCKGGERCIYFALEESPAQIIRNMQSIGLDLQKWVDEGLLHFAAHRPSLFGLETHLATMHRDVKGLKPAAVVIDPLSSLMHAGDTHDAQATVLRLVDFLKSMAITTVFTSLTHGHIETAMTDMQVSSLMDTWLLLYNRESNGEHNRQLYLIKSRGMAHSNQVREFIMTREGIILRDVYVGPEGVLTGSARVAQEARERELVMVQQHEAERRTLEFTRRRRRLEAQIEELQAELADEQAELDALAAEGTARDTEAADARSRMGESRRVAAQRSKT
jgi:circadian clock protein KaiC